MDLFQCYECGTKSLNQEKLVNHMNKAHNIKVEEEPIYKFYLCSICGYNAKNMNEYKNHQIKLHNKELHNWMVDEIRIEFKCKECDIEFPTYSSVETHMNTVHIMNRGPVKEQLEIIPENRNQVKTNTVRIVPDQNFITQNTADLKAWLDAIPKEALEYGEDVFEKDFKLVLSSEKEEESPSNLNIYNCDLCKF